MKDTRIRELAEQALTLGDPNQSRADTIATAIRTAIAEEREACAKVCEVEQPNKYGRYCALKIRERGTQ